MADRKTEDHGERKPTGPTFTAGAGAKQNQGPPAEPVKGESQKSQIAQYFKSQGRQPDDVVWELQGMSLRLKDLE